MQKFIFLIGIMLTSFILNAQEIAQKAIRNHFENMLLKEDIHNGFLQIKSADGELNFKMVSGNFQNGGVVHQSNPFHAASVGKIFTASIIMKLVETKEIQLEDPISKHLSPEIVNGLHLFEGIDYSNKITINQLLQHTSGLADYIMDEPKNGRPNIITQMFEEPNKMWEINELIAFTKAHLRPRFIPGNGYYYNDTDYLLLGLIIETKYKKALHEVFREELFIPLKMNHTAMYMRSEPIKENERLAEFYIDNKDISQYNSLSVDWAGGGTVSTTEDLIKFHEALFSGKIVGASTLDSMQQWIHESQATYYGLGLRKIHINEFSKQLPNLTLIGHNGINASFLFYCPELDIYMAGTFNQTNQVKESMLFMINCLTELLANN